GVGSFLKLPPHLVMAYESYLKASILPKRAHRSSAFPLSGPNGLSARQQEWLRSLLLRCSRASQFPPVIGSTILNLRRSIQNWASRIAEHSLLTSVQILRLHSI